VRDEQRRERDHDQVVEEERPSRDEAGEVVEGDPDERGGAAGLADRGRPLGVRQGDEQEQRADDEQDDRREAERVQGDDPEREVDRGRDLAVCDREERGGVEDALQPWQLARHGGSLEFFTAGGSRARAAGVFRVAISPAPPAAPPPPARFPTHPPPTLG
jgi:hypothetical protein